MGVQVGFGESSCLVPVEPVFGPTHRIELRDGPKRESWTAYVFNSSVPLERTGQSVRLLDDRLRTVRRLCGSLHGSYLVDPASSHMLVSKIKPCMSKYKLLYTVKLRMAH